MDLASGYVHSPDTVERCARAMRRSAVQGGALSTSPGTFSKTAASRDAREVAEYTGVKGLAEMREPQPKHMAVIYGACAFDMQWRWPAEATTSQPQRTAEGDGFRLYGHPRVLWTGRVWGSREYNAVVVEGCKTASTTRDTEVVFVLMDDARKAEWAAARGGSQKRAQLKEWFRRLVETPNSNEYWDVDEREVHVEELIVPLVDASTEDRNMEEWIGHSLGGSYVVQAAAEKTSLKMDEYGGSVKSEAAMVALKSTPAVKTSRGIVFDLRREKDGFIVFVQSTYAGQSDPQPLCLLAGVLRPG